MSFEVAPEPTEVQEDKAFREYLCEISRFLEWNKMEEEGRNEED